MYTTDLDFRTWNKVVNNWKTASISVKGWTHYCIFSIHFVLKTKFSVFILIFGGGPPGGPLQELPDLKIEPV